MQSPIAEPRIPASESGVSMQRSGPKRSSSPAVARKTPPAHPTSSPITSTESSCAISACSASFTASTSMSSATEPPLAQRRRRVGVRVLEDQLGIGGRLGLRSGDPLSHQLGGLGLEPLGGAVVEHTESAE